MRALVTGIAGFAGSHLADWLVANGDEVVGCAVEADWPRNLTHLRGRLTLERVDLLDFEAVCAVVRAARPDVVYHLAAMASTAHAVREPIDTLRANVTTTANVLHATLQAEDPPRVLHVTSGDVYGLPAGDRPLAEDTPFSPTNAYAVSKITAHYLGVQVHLAHGLPVIEARPFNHLGPRQGPGFVVPDFARQLVAIARGQAEPVLRVGDLRAQRDFTDVRDIVRGYRLLATTGRPGRVYHLCSGRGVPIAELLERLVAASGVHVRVEVDPDRLRPGPVSVIVGSHARVSAELGWHPTIDLDRSLADVLADLHARQEL
jgi:GDP-4-dehydro-6-deoxy-D-mannose reductase